MEGTLKLETMARVLSSRWAKRILVGLAVLLVLFLWLNMVRRAVQGHGSQWDDFIGLSRHLVYDGINVYREYDWQVTSVHKYPPFFPVFLSPLVPLPTPIAASIWFFLNLALAFGAAFVAVPAVDERWVPGKTYRADAYLVPFLLAAGIIGSNLETAQVNIVILFFICVALYAFRRGADAWAGLAIGLVTALKLTPGLFIVYFAYKRAFRAVAGAVAGLAICWFVIPPIVLGPRYFLEVMRGWYGIVNPFLTEGGIAEGVSGFRHTNQSLSAVFHRFFTETPAGGGRWDLYLNVVSLDFGTAGAIVMLLSLLILVLLAWICRTPASERGRMGLAFEYSLILIATLFISPISWINHYVVLLFPFVAAYYYVRTRPRASRERRLMLSALVASFLLVSSSASRLMQAFSLPFLGAVILASVMGWLVLRERRGATPGIARDPFSAASAAAATRAS